MFPASGVEERAPGAHSKIASLAIMWGMDMALLADVLLPSCRIALSVGIDIQTLEVGEVAHWQIAPMFSTAQ